MRSRPVSVSNRPRRIRSDGWTLPRQRQFIKVLALTGSVKDAADSAGMSLSSAYRLRLHPEMAAFRSAWTAALGACPSSLREIAFDRAINGTMKPIYDCGAIVGREPVLNDRLLMFLLRRYDKDTTRSPEQVMIDSFDRLVEADDPGSEMDLVQPDNADASRPNVDLSPPIDCNQSGIRKSTPCKKAFAFDHPGSPVPGVAVPA